MGTLDRAVAVLDNPLRSCPPPQISTWKRNKAPIATDMDTHTGGKKNKKEPWNWHALASPINSDGRAAARRAYSTPAACSMIHGSTISVRPRRGFHYEAGKGSMLGVGRFLSQLARERGASETGIERPSESSAHSRALANCGRRNGWDKADGRLCRTGVSVLHSVRQRLHLQTTNNWHDVSDLYGYTARERHISAGHRET
jgi:hypothetical protein